MSVGVEIYSEPLPAIRRVLTDADEALLGVAFVQQRGVNLLQHQLAPLRRSRLITTTVFGSTTGGGLTFAQEQGVDVRVLNPGRGTFHPKLYLARHGDRIAAAVGSANLTSGLIANVETVVVLAGPAYAPQLTGLWAQAEAWWAHPDAVAFSPERVATPREVLHPELLRLIQDALAVDDTVLTLGSAPQANRVHEVTADGVWVETRASRAKGRPPQLVPAWMIQIAWDRLQAHGRLTNRYLLAGDGLNVKRSSLVCALLARLPGVQLTGRRPIELRATAAGPGRSMT